MLTISQHILYGQSGQSFRIINFKPVVKSTNMQQELPAEMNP